MSKYYVIRQTEDGLALDEYETVEHAKDALFDEEVATEYQPTFLENCPSVFKGQMEVGGRSVAETAVLLIKGDIIVPKPVQRITEWEIE